MPNYEFLKYVKVSTFPNLTTLRGLAGTHDYVFHNFVKFRDASFVRTGVGSRPITLGINAVDEVPLGSLKGPSWDPRCVGQGPMSPLTSATTTEIETFYYLLNCLTCRFFWVANFLHRSLAWLALRVITLKRLSFLRVITYFIFRWSYCFTVLKWGVSLNI